MCATCQAGRVVQPPLTLIPVSDPFHRVEVDVIEFSKFHAGNQTGVVFIDYLTKCSEIFAASDRTALNTAKLFVKQIIICHHWVPAQLLSDHGAVFCHICSQRFVSCLG